MKSVITLNGKNYWVVDIANDSIWDYVIPINQDDLKYKVVVNIAYFSSRYGKWVGVEVGDKSDGATSAPDIDSFCWVFHDELCNDGKFEDGSTCTNWQASNVLSDILTIEKRWFRSITWFWATWSFGGGEARKNGMW